MKVKIAQIQAHVYEEKEKNMEELERNLERIKDENIDLVTLGEMFNCPYQTPCFPVYGEMERGETWQKLSALAKKYQIYLSAGSVPEKDEEGHVYNTAYVFDPQGNQIAKHRKVHLFDIAVLITLLVCFVVSNLLHLYAIIAYHAPFTEMITSIFYIIIFTFVLYAFWGILRLLFYGIQALFKKKNLININENK